MVNYDKRKKGYWLFKRHFHIPIYPVKGPSHICLRSINLSKELRNPRKQRWDFYQSRHILSGCVVNPARQTFTKNSLPAAKRPERETHHSSASDVKVTINYMEFHFDFPRTNSYRGTLSRGKLYIFVPKITNPSRDSSVGRVTSLWARLLRVVVRYPVMEPFSLRYPYWLCSPSSFLNHGYRGAIPPGINRPGHEADS